MKNKFRILEIFFIIVIVCCLFGLYFVNKTTAQESEAYSKTAAKYTETVSELTKDKEVLENRIVINADFPSLTKENEDVKAWLYIPDIGINYPVVQGEDNNEYMYKSWQNKDNFAGAAFIDAREDITTAQNLIVYGHSMSKDSDIMFSPLLKYKDKSFYEQHPYFYMSFADGLTSSEGQTEVITQTVDGFEQPLGEYRFDIYAVCEVNTSSNEVVEQYYKYEMTDEDMSAYMENAQNNSLYEIDCDGIPEKLVTLSTCSRPGTKNDYKLLVCGVLVKEVSL